MYSLQNRNALHFTLFKISFSLLKRILTGSDMPSSIKYHSPEITKSHKLIENQAEHELLNLLPEKLQNDYKSVMIEEEVPSENKK